MAWPGIDPPIYHGRDTYTDQGVHSLAFELHCGATLTDAALDMADRRMAQPLITVFSTDGADRPLSRG